jgi:hypothetical protein
MRCRRFHAVVVLSGLLAGSGVSALSAQSPTPDLAQDVSEAALTRARIANETAQAQYYAKAATKEPSGLPAWLQTVLGGFLAIAGSVVTLLLTTWFAERKAEETREQTFNRHKFQLQLAVKELHISLSKLTPDLPAWVNEDLVYSEPSRPTASSRDDTYYRKYDLVECVYRLCALFGWLELYRTDTAFLRGPSTRQQQRMEGLFGELRKDFANPLSTEKRELNAEAWRDGFILEEDQRAIGEKMLNRQLPDVIGYATFCETLFRSPKRDDPTGWNIPNSQNWWIWNVTRFIFELRTQRPVTLDAQTPKVPLVLALPNFAMTRVSRVISHCNELDDLLRKPV